MKKIAAFILFFLLMAGMRTTSAQAETVRQEFVPYAGIEIYTEAFNYSSKTNEAIIFLPGLGSSYTAAEFLYHTDNPYLTVSLDYLNHGKSGSLPDLSWDLHLDSIKAVLDAYDLKKVYLVGHSFGADTAMMFAQKYPKMVEKITLIDRAYYNFSELDQFNFTRGLFELLEYNPGAMDYDSFQNYLDMAYENDISKTWDIKEKVLLLGADPAETFFKETFLPELIAQIKEYPELFGLTPEQTAQLPDLTEENMTDLFDFLKAKIAAFTGVNHRFTLVQTPFSHRMIYEQENQDVVRRYILDYIKNGFTGKQLK